MRFAARLSLLASLKSAFFAARSSLYLIFTRKKEAQMDATVAAKHVPLREREGTKKAKSKLLEAPVEVLFYWRKHCAIKGNHGTQIYRTC